MKQITTDYDATLLYGNDTVTNLHGLIIESRGGTKNSNNYRNPEHSLLLNHVLKKIQKAGVTDLEIYIGARSQKYSSNASRQLMYENNVIIDTSKIKDFEAFVRTIKKSIKKSGQKENVTGGNSSKRLVLFSKSEKLDNFLEENQLNKKIKNIPDEDLEYTYQKIKKRLGQSKFRKELLIAYESTCAITDSKVTELLEAAHIHPYQGKHTSIITNGILLRSDIHDLFDIKDGEKRLINVKEDYTIEVHQSLRHSEYWIYNGKTINLPKEKKMNPNFN